MSDEDTMALNDTAEEEVSEPTTPVDETKATEEVVETNEEAAAESEEETTETEESQKKGFSARVRELSHEKNQERARADSLEKKIAELRSQLGSGTNVPYTPQVQPGQEVSPEQYNNDVQRYASSIVDLKMQQERILNRLDKEATDAIREYPELDPDIKNEKFNSELSEVITTAALSYAKTNPLDSLKLFIDKMMKPYNKAVIREVGEERENLAKQVSQSAVRPTSIRGNEKKAAEKSIAELEAELGVFQA
jgi:hypothetical protein